MTEIYESVTGERFCVEVPPELEEVFDGFRRAEQRQQKAAFRHEAPLDLECIADIPKKETREVISERVKKLIARSNIRQKKLIGYLLRGYTVNEIARMMGEPSDVVYSRLFRLRGKFA